jgi:hypothetical protein
VVGLLAGLLGAAVGGGTGLVGVVGPAPAGGCALRLGPGARRRAARRGARPATKRSAASNRASAPARSASRSAFAAARFVAERYRVGSTAVPMRTEFAARSGPMIAITST